MDQVGNVIQPVEARGGVMRESPAFTALKRLHKNEFRVNWRDIPPSKTGSKGFFGIDS